MRLSSFVRATDEHLSATAGLYRSRPFDVKQVHVHDMRGRESEFSLDKQGFEHHKHNIAFDAFDDTARTQAEYWPAVAEFLKDRYVPSRSVVRSSG